MRNGPSRGNHLGLPNQQYKAKGQKKSISLNPTLNYYGERQMAQVSIIATYLLVQSSEHEI